MTSNGRGRVSSKSDFILKGALTKHLIRGQLGQKGPISSDVIYRVVKRNCQVVRLREFEHMRARMAQLF